MKTFNRPSKISLSAQVNFWLSLLYLLKISRGFLMFERAVDSVLGSLKIPGILMLKRAQTNSERMIPLEISFCN